MKMTFEEYFEKERAQWSLEEWNKAERYPGFHEAVRSKDSTKLGEIVVAAIRGNAVTKKQRRKLNLISQSRKANSYFD